MTHRIRIAALLLAAGLIPGVASAQACTSALLVTDPTSPLFLAGDTHFGATQDGMNCYSWQMFLALNWPVDPAWPGTSAAAGEPDRTAGLSSFGVPTSGEPMTDATVWQSFMPAPGVFKTGGATPDPWGRTGTPPAGCTALGTSGGGHVRSLNVVAKAAVHPVHGFNLSTGTEAVISDETLEATGNPLVDQDGNVVFFERLMGKAEYDYIVSNGLFDASNQESVVNSAIGLVLPSGQLPAKGLTKPQPQADLGAFELKAAWRTLTHRPELWDRYLTTTAYLTHPDGACDEAVVGLVGLHIIHKTDSLPSFVWTTFEHVDNVPDGGSAPGAGYSFNNGTNSPAPNVPPVCTGTGSGRTCDETTPVQVTRLVPTPQQLKTVNGDMQSFFATQTGGQSVFQYYKLVNVLWPSSPNRTNPAGPGAKVPLSYGSFTSAANAPVANTTMETYVQYGIGSPPNPSCNACHEGATIAGSKTLASDFSFLFSTAHSAADVDGVTLAPEFGQ